MPFSSFFYLHLTNDREHAIQPSCSPFCSLFYLSTRRPIVERVPIPSLFSPHGHPFPFPPLFFLHRYTGRQEASSRDVPLFLPLCSLLLLFLSHRRTTLSRPPSSNSLLRLFSPFPSSSSVSSCSSCFPCVSFSRPRPCGIRTGVRFGGTRFEPVGITAFE